MQKPPTATIRYDAQSLETLATALLKKTGLGDDRSRIVATTLLEGDLMGHTTHGLSLLPLYLRELEADKMAKTGEPIVIKDAGSAVTWDGGYLPGPWLVHQAIDLAVGRIHQHPVMTVAIRRSHHIACLAAYLEKVARQGLLIQLSCSDPMNATVAPFGGLQGVYSPNPIAVGIPTNGDPILFDISASTTANGLVHQKYKEGSRLPHPWLMDNQGQPTDDPTKFFEDPPATILPLGGLDAGYKGFALGLLVEALTNGLGGHGRTDQPTQWGGSVFLQIIDPEAFSGLEYFKKEMDQLVEKSLATKPRSADSPVRMPGSRALALRDEQRKNGVRLYPTIAPALAEWALKYGLEMPRPIV